MRAIILAAGAVLTLSACGGGGSEGEQNGVDTLSVNNLVVDSNTGTTGLDTNLSTNGATTTDPATGATLDPASQNAIQQDLTTNTPDANLANGL